MNPQLNNIRRQRDDLLAEASQLLDDNPAGLDDEAQTRYDEITTEVEALNHRYTEVHESREQERDRLRQLATGGGLRVEGGADGRHDAPAVHRSGVRGDALRHIESDRTAPDAAKHVASRLVETDDTDRAARWAAAAADPAYLQAFTKLVRDPVRGHMEFTTAEQTAFNRAQHEARSMSLTDADGGFLVPFTLDPAIVLTDDGVIDPVRGISRNVTTATDSWNGVTSAGVTTRWGAEGTEANDDSPTLTQPSITVHKADSFVPFSIEVGMDSGGLVEQLRALFADAKANHEAAAWINGTGVGQPFGIITALAGGSSEVSPATAETFASADVYATIEALPPRFRARARWAAELSTLNQIQQFETAAGAREFPGIPQTPPVLLRRPAHETSEMDPHSGIDAAVTADNHILLVGDFAHYVIVDRIGSTLELVPHLFGTNGRPTGERGAYFYWRVGADVTVDGAFRVLNVNTTA